MTLLPQETRGPIKESEVLLVDSSVPGGFLCRGDESAVCCGFQQDTEVLAQGIAAGHRGGYRLLCPRLCGMQQAPSSSAGKSGKND